MKNSVTAAYKRSGALLTLHPMDAFLLENQGLGSHDPMGDAEGLLGFHVPGDKVDEVVSGEHPVLHLVGGWMLARGDVDRLVGIREVELPSGIGA